MPEWGVLLKLLNWLKPWAMALLRDDIDKQIESRTEVYRRQLEDRDRWLQDNESSIRKIYENKIEAQRSESDRHIVAVGEEAKVWEARAREERQLYIGALIPLTFMAFTYPLGWANLRQVIKPEVRQLVEGGVEELRKQLSPPSQPQPPLLSDFNLAVITGGIGIGTLLAEGGKDKDKDPSKR